MFTRITAILAAVLFSLGIVAPSNAATFIKCQSYDAGATRFCGGAAFHPQADGVGNVFDGFEGDVTTGCDRLNAGNETAVVWELEKGYNGGNGLIASGGGDFDCHFNVSKSINTPGAAQLWYCVKMRTDVFSDNYWRVIYHVGSGGAVTMSAVSTSQCTS